MKPLGEEINDWREYISDYLSAEAELFKLRLVDKLTVLYTGVVTNVIIIGFLTMMLLFASVALALWLGDVLNSLPLGFFCVSGIYLLLMLVFLALRRPLVEKPIIKTLIKFVFEKPIDHDQNT